MTRTSSLTDSLAFSWGGKETPGTAWHVSAGPVRQPNIHPKSFDSVLFLTGTPGGASDQSMSNFGRTSALDESEDGH